MIHRPIIPNRKVILALPPQPNLQIMVIRNQINKPLQSMLALRLRQPIDLLHVVADGEDGFPARDGIGADHRVDGLEFGADVLGRAAWRAVQLESVVFGGFFEPGLRVCGAEAIEEPLVWS